MINYVYANLLKEVTVTFDLLNFFGPTFLYECLKNGPTRCPLALFFFMYTALQPWEVMMYPTFLVTVFMRGLRAALGLREAALLLLAATRFAYLFLLALRAAACFFPYLRRFAAEDLDDDDLRFGALRFGALLLDASRADRRVVTIVVCFEKSCMCFI